MKIEKEKKLQESRKKVTKKSSQDQKPKGTEETEVGWKRGNPKRENQQERGG